MKTRSNMPLFVVECSDVKALSNAQIDLLRCGDYLVKKDASGEHAYKVTFKSATGMCLTYHDASVIETQSYDKVGDNWVYNSEDKTPNLLEVQEELTPTKVEDGTLNKVLGFDGDGDLVKGSVGGGTQIVPFATTYVDVNVGDDFPDTKSGVENYEPPANKSYAGLPLAFMESDSSTMLSLCGGIFSTLDSPQIGSNYTIESIGDIPNNFISMGVSERSGRSYCVLKSPSGRFYVATIAWN